MRKKNRGNDEICMKEFNALDDGVWTLNKMSPCVRTVGLRYFVVPSSPTTKPADLAHPSFSAQLVIVIYIQADEKTKPTRVQVAAPQPIPPSEAEPIASPRLASFFFSLYFYLKHYKNLSLSFTLA